MIAKLEKEKKVLSKIVFIEKNAWVIRANYASKQLG